ncbi:hypothetical protein FQR65_LT01959 [Abscondita terminalis]|nr:hypothetical protein FQR65_LT01959 [Abscondita terminalis]
MSMSEMIDEIGKARIEMEEIKLEEVGTLTKRRNDKKELITRGGMDIQHNLDDNLDRYADLSSFYWSTTTAYWTILIIRGYCKLLISNLDNMELIWKAFEKHKPTYLFLTPFVLRRVWHSKPVNANVDYIKTIKVGGAAMSIQEVMQLRQAFPKATIPFGYGATEVAKPFFNNGIITTPSRDKFEWESQSIGCVFYQFMKKHSNKLLQIVSASDRTIKIFAFGDSGKLPNFFDLLIPHPKENEFAPVEVDINKTAFIFFSSGSTNMPKAIHISHRVFLRRTAHVINIDDHLDLFADLSTFYWSTTTAYWTILIIRGCCKLLLKNLDNMDLIWNAFEIHKPTYLYLSPFVLRRVWHSKPVNANVDYIKTIKVGGAAMPAQEVIQLRQAFPKTTFPFGYGSTEAGLLLMCPTKTEHDLEFYKKKIGSTGTVLNGICYKIVSVDTDEVLGPYQKGELKVKTKNVVSSSCNSFINGSIDDDGWFKTGDVLYYDDDFYFYYVERLKQMVKYRSHHISPRMIENVLLTKDYVSNVSVIGIPHELDEEHAMAVVELKPTSVKKEDIENEIVRSVEEKLGGKFLLRGGIKFLERIPTTATGKCDVRKLKSMFVKNIN